ncbi:unnamed protein product [Periconia digitata]|uniref:Uncharacterized protein n=1 Tax=Periconia digitata TaxID=1303443 RepID=A0A9W4XSA1_9PLEO|nr:unnamed protein product [Periconia digitata]
MEAEKRAYPGLLHRLSQLSIQSAVCSTLFTSHARPVFAFWVVAGGLRVAYRDPKVISDGILFGIVCALNRKDNVLSILGQVLDAFHSSTTAKSLMSLLAAGGILVFLRRQTSKTPTFQLTNDANEETLDWTLAHPKPLIFPCRTTHARIFPKKHSFGYDYLLCGYPIIPTGTTQDGKDINDGRDQRLGFWWLHIRAEDYLKRGQGSLGFYNKLQSYLRQEGVQDAEWSYAYLVTAPRFFGYSFNPVSFWYIYNSQHDLTKMILEVNNTFDERRLYLLDGSSPPSPPQTSVPGNSAPVADRMRFTDVWMKDFHVSPFNSRKGSYALKALNPFPSPSYGDPKIDNNITLQSSKDHSKLVARVYSTGSSISPDCMRMTDFVRFLAGWCWVGFLTSPRIIREASRLYFQRSLHVWFRPEVVETSIGRKPTSTESHIEEVFRDYLDHLVQNSSKPIELHYESAIPNEPKTWIIRSTADPHVERRRLDIRVTTPAFYSRLVHYAHISEAFDREHTFTDERNRTLWISRPEILFELCTGKPNDNKDQSRGRSFIDELQWSLLRRLRCPPADAAYPVTPKRADMDIDDIRTLPFSDIDRFVRDGKGYAGLYRRMVTKIFIAQRFALGFTEAVDVVDFAIRVLLCWVSYRSFVAWEADCEKQITSNAACIWRFSAVGTEWIRVSGRVVAVCAWHMYGLLKGYR